MKVKFGLVVTDGAGKLGGHLVTENKTGKIIRENRKPVQCYSKSQKIAKGIFAKNSQTWRELTGAEIYVWNAAAVNWKYTNRFGDAKELSGQQLFMQLNGNILGVGGNILTVPPVKVAVSEIESIEIIVTNLEFKVDCVASTVLDNEIIVVEATKSLRKSIFYVKDKFRKMDEAENVGNNEFDIYSEYVEKFGSPVVGQKIFVKVYVVNKITGQVGIFRKDSKIVEEAVVNPILDGNTVAWYDYLDLSTIVKSEDDLVSEWKDKLLSGRDLRQNHEDKMPFYEDDGIIFESEIGYMKTSGFEYEQPEMIYIVVQYLDWEERDIIFDGYVSYSGILIQKGGELCMQAAAGMYSGANSELGIEEFGIVRVRFDGVNSKLQVNRTDSVDGNFGLNDMNGFTLGSNGGGSKYFSFIQVKEIILRKVADSEADEEWIYSYLATKYGI